MLTQHQKEFQEALEFLVKECRSVRSAMAFLQVSSPRTIYDWLPPTERRPKCKGRMPSLLIREGVISMAKAIGYKPEQESQPHVLPRREPHDPGFGSLN